MKFIDLLKLSTRMFKARTSRTLLTILGMGVGISAILFLVSLGYGLQKTLLEKITTADSLLTLDIEEENESSVFLDKAILEKIKNIEGVEKVSPIAHFNSQVHLYDLSVDLLVFGTDSSFLKLSNIKIEDGRQPDFDKKEEIIVSSSLAKTFGKKSEELLGKEVSFSFFISEDKETKNLGEKLKRLESENKYKIVGIAVGDSEDSVAYVNWESLNFEVNRFSRLKVKCHSNRAMETVREQIIEMGLLVSSLSDTVDQANKIFRVIQIVLMLFGVIALIVSAIGMFNTMTITLLERTSEIGIMKSIGASDKSISAMFIIESAIMGFLGGVCGIGIGFFEGFVFNGTINLIAVQMGGEKVNLFYSPLWFIMTIIIFSILVGMLTGLAPARRASKIDPLEALRYK